MSLRFMPMQVAMEGGDGHVCATNSPYSRQKYASSPPTTSTVMP